MGLRVNPNWLSEKLHTLDYTGELDVTVSYNKAAQSLIEALSVRDKMFKVYNLGAGVKRITTDTEVCPCCKRKV